MVITLVLATVALFSPLWDRSGDTVLRLARFWSHLLMRMSGVALTVEVAQPLDPRRPYVFMANHLSAADIPSLFVAVPFPVRMIAKKSLGHIPVFGWAMRAGRFIFINRKNPIASRRSIDEAAQRIHAGHSVLLFPEGTRSRDGYLGPFKKGGFYLAIASGAEVVPCGIRGTREVLPPRHLFVRRGAITVRLGAPIATTGMTEDDRDALLERVRGLIVEMTGQPPRPEPPPSEVSKSRATA